MKLMKKPILNTKKTPPKTLPKVHTRWAVLAGQLLSKRFRLTTVSSIFVERARQNKLRAGTAAHVSGGKVPGGGCELLVW